MFTVFGNKKNKQNKQNIFSIYFYLILDMAAIAEGRMAAAAAAARVFSLEINQLTNT